MGFKSSDFPGAKIGQQGGTIKVTTSPAADASTPKKERRGRMNKWEATYAAMLDLRVAAGEILWYGFEASKWRLAKGAWYTPDFTVLLADGTVEFYEVKGHWRDAARIRCKVFSELVPWPLHIVGFEDGRWYDDVMRGPLCPPAVKR